MLHNLMMQIIYDDKRCHKPVPVPTRILFNEMSNRCVCLADSFFCQQSAKGKSMEIIKFIIQSLAAFSGSLAALMSIPLLLRLHWPAPFLWIIKLYASALSPLLALVGVLCAIAGWATGSVFISLTGVYAGLIFFIHLYTITRPPNSSGSFEKAFGLHWESSLYPEQKKHFLPGRTTLKLPAVPHPRLQQNIPFATIPDTNRQLLCDVWQPPGNVSLTGLVFIYLHGSAWYLLDKDVGTRPFFSHLASQGHVVVDVAYRLSPETDIMGMVHDVKRAIAWIKKNGDRYGVNADRIVVGGGSAGGHLALLAAYTANNSGFTPNELEGKDISVCGAISLYGPADLAAMYYHTNQQLTTRSIPSRPKKTVPVQIPAWIIKRMGENYHRLGMDKGFENAGALARLLGGHPDERPETYALFSPITHVHAHCPPTLLIHGEHDLMAPAATTRLLNTRLVGAKVKTVMHILPQTDHAFDLVLPRISLSAHNAIYDVERFLALLLKNFEDQGMTTEENEQYQLNHS